MLRFFFIGFILFQSLLFGSADIFQEYETRILDIDGRVGKIADNENIVIGSSGIVMHRFDNETNTIIARGVVVKKDGAYATIRFKVFDALEQKAFPLPGILPQKGDKIILNYLYNRSLIVVPNEAIFQEVTNHFKDIEWIHPDVMAAYLASERKPNPTREYFKKMCYQNSTGLIFIALEGAGYFADCVSFKVLKSLKSGHIASYQVPFFNRVGKIDTMIWDLGSETIKSYNRHYSSLLVE